MYAELLGFNSEMVFRANGINTPGFARTAPAPRIAIAGDAATLPIRWIMLASFSGLVGRRRSRTTQTSSRTPPMTSMTATHVFGVDLLCEAAASPSTNAAATPIARVATSAPR
jgi:hypothetical protein